MAYNLFGFEFKRKEEKEQSQVVSFTPKESDDGALTVAAGGAYGTYVDLDGTVRTEAELVTKYRDMALHPETDAAVDEIVNESISAVEDDVVDINLDKTKLSPAIKKVVIEEFKNCLKLLDFTNHAYEIYRRWYVDGRLYYHTIIDETQPRDGIKELRYIDPRKIRKVREVQKKRAKSGDPTEASLTKVVNEYFIYNDRGFNYGNKVATSTTAGTSGLKIAKDSIVYTVSGLTDTNGTMVLSYLHKGIKALNQLRTLEDAMVIYRLSRAPERRIWYIDVGNLPKMKAEQYVRDIMVKHKNRLVYDASSGEVRDDRKFMTMLEDYWLPRREGGRGTEVTTLPGGQNLSQMDDVLYFQKKFLNSLNVPVSRLNSDALFSLGRATEITRDELKFARFIVRLRQKFSMLFLSLLEKQLVLKGIMTIEEWKEISGDVRFDFARDNYFAELKDAEILKGRVDLARDLQDMAGKYISHQFIRKEVLKQSDEDIEEMDEQIMTEMESGDPRWMNPMIEQNVSSMTAAANPQGEPQQQSPEDSEENDKINELRQALVFVRAMKKKGRANRTDQEQSQYKAAVQLLAKNPDVLQSMGLPADTGQEPE